jgi:hypothetical protein
VDEQTDVDKSPPVRRMPGNLTAAFRRVDVPRPAPPFEAPAAEEESGSRRTGKRRAVAILLAFLLAWAVVVLWGRPLSHGDDTAAAPAAAVTEAPPAVADPVTPAPAAAGQANPSGTDLAHQGTATASGIEAAAWEPRFAIDGDPVSRWSSAFKDPQWISVDLRQRWQISKVTLVWEASYGVRYHVDTSLDGKTWTTVWSTTSGRGGTVVIPVPPKDSVARYVRMVGTRRVSTYGYSLYEFEVR